jgi:hypothetical protein
VVELAKVKVLDRSHEDANMFEVQTPQRSFLFVAPDSVRSHLAPSTWKRITLFSKIFAPAQRQRMHELSP